MTRSRSHSSILFNESFDYVTGNTSHSPVILGGSVSDMDLSISGAGDVSVMAQPLQQGRIDEIRVATTFNEVINVPEPSVALLGAIGFLALPRRRR